MNPIRLEQNFAEAKRMLGGLRSIQRQLPEPDPTTLAISIFSAANRIAREGEFSSYEISIASCRPDNIWVDLEIDICSQDSQLQRCGFSKRIFVRPRIQMMVGLKFDWKEDAAFDIEGVEFPADEFRRGLSTEMGPHVLTASLRSTGLDLHAPLAIVQELV